MDKAKGQKEKTITYTVPLSTEMNKNIIDQSRDILESLSEKEIISKGLKLHEEGNIEEAKKYYNYFISKGYNDSSIFFNFALILKDIGKLKNAEDLIRKSIELKPNRAESYYILGSILEDQSEQSKAESCYRKALQINPSMVEGYISLGNIMRNNERLKEAELLQRTAIKINPNSLAAILNLGNILKDQNKLEKAEKYINKAIKLNPEYEPAIRNLGICQYLRGNYKDSLKNIVKANKINPMEKSNKIILHFLKGRRKDIEIILKRNPLLFKLEVNKDIINYLYKIKGRDQEKYQSPTYGKAIGSDYDFFQRDNKLIKSLEKDLISIIKNNLKGEVLISESFFTIFSSGGGLKSHNHLSKLDNIKELNIAARKFSLVYYLSIGDQNCKEPGILKMEDPNQNILPTDGLIVIFPAARKHSVCYQGNKDRIIIGVNFYIN